MRFRWGKKKAVEPEPVFTGACLPDQKIQAIGDIHGCDTLLQVILQKLDPESPIVALGDFVDRGPNSRAVLELLFQKNTEDPENFICLMGNHEAMMLEFFDDPAGRGQRWLRYGGLETLLSYGISGARENSKGQDAVNIRDALVEKITPEIQRWIRNLPVRYSSGNLHVVHAGMDPSLPVEAQSNSVLVWGHDDFFTKPRQDDAWVLHGHTIFELPSQSEGRISIDTGAYHSGRLTAAVCLTSGEVYFEQAC